jgi:DNA polymerase IV
VQRQKAVVTPQWLRDSVAHGSSLPCEDYAALSELRYTTRQNCPACGCSGHQTSEDDPEDIGATTRERIAKRIAKRLKRETPCTQCQCDCIRSSSSCAKHNGLPSPPSSSSDIVIISRPSTPPVNFLTPETTPSKHPSSECTLLIDMPALRTPAYLLPPSSPVLTNMSRLRHDAPYACQRASPLKCPNQDLVDALNIIKQSRNLEGESRSELSYMRGIAVIKGEKRFVSTLARV